jgi:hypothetical protein
MTPMFIQPWPFACCAAIAARQPVLAVAAPAAGARSLRRTLRTAGVPDADLPTRTVTTAAAQGAALTWLGLGRYLVQFAPWLLAGGLLSRRTRLAAAGLALAPILSEWAERDRPLDPVRFAAGCLADEIAYGAGVVSGSVRARTIVPLRPVVVRRST